MEFKNRLYGVLTLLIVVVVCTLSTVYSTPEFAARVPNRCDTACHGFIGSLPQWAPKTRCSLGCMGCHVSPTGGGIRHDYGFNYGKKSLPFELIKAHDDIEPKIGKYLRIGGDLRALYRDTEHDEVVDKFFLMESNLYAAAEVHDKLSIVLEHDLKNEFGQYYALIKDLPLNMYFMVGRFVPAFGLKLDDHTAFTRDNLGFGVRAADDGILFGFNPGRPYFNFAYTNGAPGNKGFDTNRYKAMTLNLGYWHEWFSVGGSYRRNKLSATGSETEISIIGANVTAHFWRLSYLGEVDRRKHKVEFQDHDDNTETIVAMHQINYFPMKGLNIKLQYDFIDPDTDIKDDAISRYSAGVQVYPMPFLELSLLYRMVEEESDFDNDEIVFVFHGYF